MGSPQQDSKETTPESSAAASPLPTQASRLTVVGVGGMGIHCLDLLQEQSADFANAIAVDTDQTVLDQCRAVRRVQIGARLTRGRGTGGDPSLGRRAANGDFPQLRELFHNSDLVIFITGLGGGMGSGATPVLAQTARDEGALVMTVGALPFEYEGADRMDIAQAAVDRLKTAGHGLILVSNQALMENGDPAQPMTEALSQAATHLGLALRWLWNLLGQRNLIHLDWITLKNMLESCDGYCHLAVAEAGGQHRANLLLTRLGKHPAFTISAEAKGRASVLIGLQGSADMTLHEVQEIVDGVMKQCPPQTARWVGAGIDRSMRGKLGALVLWAEQTHPVPAETKSPAVKPRKSAPKASPQQVTEQKELGLDAAPLSKGRFKDVEPTVVQGEDLDLPTFIRRGMKLSH